MTFILLAAVPEKRSAAVSDFVLTRPASLAPLPLTRFVKLALDRIRDHEFPQAITPAESELTFRLGSLNLNPES